MKIKYKPQNNKSRKSLTYKSTKNYLTIIII
ncbi:hypothetical protein Catovirus_1_647 [Catovirus CTV1]|uniref:Uncharacterized protein n=1 Tax=Catovirus CTV1 TaxID=1977631 RepID=A0A1V0SA51_9VIRU|nr:hypothetical protein Catovirus_1_647 [Catovirus CTV1]